MEVGAITFYDLLPFIAVGFVAQAIGRKSANRRGGNTSNQKAHRGDRERSPTERGYERGGDGDCQEEFSRVHRADHFAGANALNKQIAGDDWPRSSVCWKREHTLASGTFKFTVDKFN